MTIVIDLATMIAALALIVSAFWYVFDPRGAVALLKTVALRLLAIILGVAVLSSVAAQFSHDPTGSALAGLFLLSLTAYVTRKFRMRNDRKIAANGRVRGAERTPVLPHHMENH